MPLFKVFLLVNLFQLLYTALLTLVKDMMTYRAVGVFEFAFFRSAINMISSAMLVKCKYNETFFTSVPRNQRPTLLVRCVSGTIAFLCYTTAPKYLPIGIC